MTDVQTTEEDGGEEAVWASMMRSLGKCPQGTEQHPPSWDFPQGGMGATGSHQCVDSWFTNNILKIFQEVPLKKTKTRATI